MQERKKKTYTEQYEGKDKFGKILDGQGTVGDQG